MLTSIFKMTLTSLQEYKRLLTALEEDKRLLNQRGEFDDSRPEMLDVHIGKREVQFFSTACPALQLLPGKSMAKATGPRICDMIFESRFVSFVFAQQIRDDNHYTHKKQSAKNVIL